MVIALGAAFGKFGTRLQAITTILGVGNGNLAQPEAFGYAHAVDRFLIVAAPLPPHVELAGGNPDHRAPVRADDFFSRPCPFAVPGPDAFQQALGGQEWLK